MVSNVSEHYEQLIRTTESRIEERRKNNDPFSEIDDDLTYLTELRKKQANLFLT